MENFRKPIEWEQEVKGEEDNLRKREKKVGLKQIAKLNEKVSRKKFELQQKKENDWDWEEKRLKDRLK